MPAIAEVAKINLCTCTTTDDDFTTREDGLAIHIGCGLPTLSGLRDHLAERQEATKDEPLLDGVCESCGTDIKVEPGSVPEAKKVCVECAKGELRDKQGTVVRRPRIAKHQPRVECTPEEQAVADARHHKSVDLSKLTDAELGRMVRQGLISVVMDTAEANRNAAIAAKAAKEKEAQALRTAERERHQGAKPLAGFTIDTVTVPELDVASLDLNATTTTKQRSPYNQARHRLGEVALDPEFTLGSDLIVEHLRLAEIAPRHKPAKRSRKATKDAQIAAALDEQRQAKVAEVMAITGLSEAQVLAVLA